MNMKWNYSLEHVSNMIGVMIQKTFISNWKFWFDDLTNLWVHSKDGEVSMEEVYHICCLVSGEASLTFHRIYISIICYRPLQILT